MTSRRHENYGAGFESFFTSYPFPRVSGAMTTSPPSRQVWKSELHLLIIGLVLNGFREVPSLSVPSVLWDKVVVILLGVGGSKFRVPFKMRSSYKIMSYTKGNKTIVI